MEKLYYLDNAATTKVFDEVFDIMKECNKEFYNPSASYAEAIKVKKSLDNSRKIVSDLMRGNGGKLYFTSSATESNNTVFFGVHLRKGQTVLISKGEHPAVYNAAHRLEKDGIIVKEIPLDENGKVNEDEFKNLLDNTVALVSVIHVSNETGAINDIKKLCEITKGYNSKILFHSDGVQAFGKVKVNLQNLGVDLYTISAHKIYAPRGIAGLWVKQGVVIDALLVGGGQEDGFRSSTENVAGAAALAYSAKKMVDEMQQNNAKVEEIKRNLLSKLENSEIKDYFVCNSNEGCLPYILSLSFDKIKGEVLMYSLEADGILISTGSACSSKKAGNRTLQAMGKSDTEIIGSVRISFSPYEEYDVEYIANSIIKNVLRFEKNVMVKK